MDRKGGNLSICHQCEILGINRSTLYYTPARASSVELELMRHLDELYRDDSTRGALRMRACLQNRGYTLGRYKVRCLMRQMRLKTVYCHPRTTIMDPTRYKYPYLLRNLEITHSNQVWALDITYIPMKRGYMYLLAIMDL